MINSNYKIPQLLRIYAAHTPKEHTSKAGMNIIQILKVAIQQPTKNKGTKTFWRIWMFKNSSVRAIRVTSWDSGGKVL